MKNLLFTFNDIGPKAAATVAKAFTRAGANVAQAGSDGKVRRSSGISYRELNIMFVDGQTAALRIKQSGDVFQVTVNGAVTPIRNQDDHAKAIAEIVKVLDAGRAKFQKKLAMKRAELPKGIKTAAPTMEKALQTQVAQLDEQIAAATTKRDALKEEAAMDSAGGKLFLWKYDPATGFWKQERDVTAATADQWLKEFQKDEPKAAFKVSAKKPTGKPALDGAALDGVLQLKVGTPAKLDAMPDKAALRDMLVEQTKKLGVAKLEEFGSYRDGKIIGARATDFQTDNNWLLMAIPEEGRVVLSKTYGRDSYSGTVATFPALDAVAAAALADDDEPALDDAGELAEPAPGQIALFDAVGEEEKPKDEPAPEPADKADEEGDEKPEPKAEDEDDQAEDAPKDDGEKPAPEKKDEEAMDAAKPKVGYTAFNVDAGVGKFTVIVKTEPGMTEADARKDALTAAYAEMGSAATRIKGEGKPLKALPDDSWEAAKAKGWAWVAKGHVASATDAVVPECLLGSSVQPSLLDIGGQEVQLGEVVRRAHLDSALSAADWNALPEEDREGKIAAALDSLRAEASAPVSPSLDAVDHQWHSRTMERMKRLPEESLRYIYNDATEAAEIGEKAGYPAEKTGRYRDEAHYATMELNRRRKMSDAQALAGIAKEIKSANNGKLLVSNVPSDYWFALERLMKVGKLVSADFAGSKAIRLPESAMDAAEAALDSAGKTTFGELAEGDRFHMGKSKGAGAQKDTVMWEEFEKVGASKAKVVAQHGYGNRRGIGDVKPVSAAAVVWRVEKAALDACRPWKPQTVPVMDKTGKLRKVSAKEFDLATKGCSIVGWEDEQVFLDSDGLPVGKIELDKKGRPKAYWLGMDGAFDSVRAINKALHACTDAAQARRIAAQMQPALDSAAAQGMALRIVNGACFVM